MKEYTGKFGIVLLPDADIASQAVYLSSQIANNRLDLGGTHVPHLTLYHTKVKDLPLAEVQGIIASINVDLPLQVNFSLLSAFGGRFAFWNTEKNHDLAKLHKRSLQMSKFFDSEGEQQADSEDLALSRVESENVRQYGHPLVLSLWQPHITVGYVTGGYNESGSNYELAGSLIKAAFVRVGDYGTIDEVIVV